MTYDFRLKDQKLQRQLDEISDGDFSKRLNDVLNTPLTYAHLMGDFMNYPSFYIAFGPMTQSTSGDFESKYHAIFTAQEIEVLPANRGVVEQIQKISERKWNRR